VAVGPKGDQVALGMGDKVVLWKLGKGATGLSDQRVLESAHKDPVKEIVYMGDGKKMVSGHCVCRHFLPPSLPPSQLAPGEVYGTLQNVVRGMCDKTHSYVRL